MIRAWRLRRLHPMVLAIVATLCAAALVFYLEFVSISALQAQTRLILRQVSEQAAGDVAIELQRIADGPVFDTLTAVNHPELRAGRLDLVATEYDEGLRLYRHVDRYFVWHGNTERVVPGEVLFYGREQQSASTVPATSAFGQGFVRDPALGRAILSLARRHAPSQQIYVAADGFGPDGRLGVLVRLFWADANRRDYFALLGFVVERAAMPASLVAALGNERIETTLRRRGENIPLRLRVLAEGGHVVYGGSDPPAPIAARVTVPFAFHPTEIGPRLAVGVEPRPLTVEVSTTMQGATFAGVQHGYWPTVLSIVLMLVALGLTLQANRRAAELAAMQTEFISHVSHQLKTPLSLLSAASETVALDRVRSPEKLLQYVEIIRVEVAKLSALVQRILESARTDRPRRYEKESIALLELVSETVEAFAASLSGRQFIFRIEHDGPAPVVEADPAALEQVLANLLDNAVKYSGESREVVARVGVQGGRAYFEVADRGVGISQEDRRRIFEKFYRGAGRARCEGFGLGLSIVQELVRAHRGSISVRSVPNSGSTFRVTLPLSGTVRTERVLAHGPVDVQEVPQ